MENHIVNEPAKKIREIARQALNGFWKPVILAVLIYYLLTTGVTTILDYFFTFRYPVELYGQSLQESVSYGGGLYQFILGGPLEYGMIMYLLAFFRSKMDDKTMLFEGFSNFGKSFLLMLIMTIKVALWSLLLVIPGIIAAIRYSQSFYIMIDNPDLTPNQCIKESCRLMQGNKAAYFVLQLTFIGWLILAALPSSIYLSVYDGNTFISSVLLMIVLSLPGIAVDAYMMTANTAFYELLTERLVVVNPFDESKYNANYNESYTINENPRYNSDDNDEGTFTDDNSGEENITGDNIADDNSGEENIADENVSVDDIADDNGSYSPSDEDKNN